MGPIRWVVGRLLMPQSPVHISQRFLPEARRRFYRSVTVAGTGNDYEVNLDHRKLKTPMGNVFQVPNHGLALAVAHEWASVKDKIQPSLMHLTSLSNTVLDNPARGTKWDFADKILEYLETDTVLFPGETTDDLVELQRREWDPVIEWFNKKFEIDLQPAVGICGADIPMQARESIRRYLLSYDIWAITGFLYGVEALKSVILTVAAAERKLTAEKAVALSRLELQYQTSRWGSVEWAHDLDQYDLEARFSAALLFILFNTSQTSVKQKTKQ